MSGSYGYCRAAAIIIKSLVLIPGQSVYTEYPVNTLIIIFTLLHLYTIMINDL